VGVKRIGKEKTKKHALRSDLWVRFAILYRYPRLVERLDKIVVSVYLSEKPCKPTLGSTHISSVNLCLYVKHCGSGLWL